MLDRWIRSRLHRTVRTVTDALEAFDSLSGAQALAELVDDLSNWYVRRSRPRFWKSSDPAAHATLHECLLTITQLLAPFCPFITDELYRNLAGTDRLRAPHRLARRTTTPRSTTRSKRRWTIARAARVARPRPRAATPRSACANRSRARSRCSAADESLRDDVVHEIADELNVKRFEVVTTLEGLLSYRVVPNFRALGPRVGKLHHRVKALLADVDGADVQRAFDDAGPLRPRRRRRGRARSSPTTSRSAPSSTKSSRSRRTARYAVALDLTLDDDLRAEGKARELSRAINDLRKARGLRDQRPHRRALRRRRRSRRGRGTPPRLDHDRGPRHRRSRRSTVPLPDTADRVEIGGEPIPSSSKA